MAIYDVYLAESTWPLPKLLNMVRFFIDLLPPFNLIFSSFLEYSPPMSLAQSFVLLVENFYSE